MIFGKILRKGYIPILTQAEVTAWLAETPIENDIVFNSERNAFAITDGAGGVTYTDVPKVFYEDLNPNTGTATYTWQAGKNIIALFMNETNLRVDSVAPADATWIQYNNSTGDLTLFTGQTFNGEWVHIIYDNYPAI
jgi:hypothetical protein